MTTEATETTTDTPSIDEEAFDLPQVMTIVGAHFVHDTYSAFLAPLLPVIQERLQSNYQVTGSLAVIPQIPSLLNPFIGYLADRLSLRYFIILAPGVTATLMSVLGLVSTYAALAMLLFAAGISIAVFHAPAPAMIAHVAGRRVGKGMSLFMAGGELGRTIGPLVLVGGISWFGLEGLWRLAVIGWLTSLVLYFRLRNISARPASAQMPSLSEAWERGRDFFLALIWLQITRVFLMAPLTTYLPLFMTDVVGVSLELSAASLTILEAAGVVGALGAGTLSDRVGRLRLLAALLLIAPALLLLFVFTPGWMAVPLLILLGLASISPTPVLLALVQDYFPDNRALANGTFLSINFLSRAVAIYAVGWMADVFGLANAFLGGAVVAWLSLGAVYWLSRIIGADRSTPIG
jgi:FSR family fosmidomycin resistance protein-like MFS transporter